jgi:transketolase
MYLTRSVADPQGMAAVAHVLYSRHMNFNGKSSKWWNRDRFVLSNGHAYVLALVLAEL